MRSAAGFIERHATLSMQLWSSFKAKNGRNLASSNSNALKILARWSAAPASCDRHGLPYRSDVDSSSSSSGAGAGPITTTPSPSRPRIMFQGTVYNDTNVAALVDAIVAASTVQPHKRSLQTCVEGALKPVGLSRGITIHGSNARAVFEWHISRG
eukprot:gene16795-28004_t